MEVRNKIPTELQAVLMKEILSFNEACLYLNLSASWLYKLTYSNKIAYYKPNGKKIYFKREDLVNWLSRNRCKTQDEIAAEATEYTTKNRMKK